MARNHKIAGSAYYIIGGLKGNQGCVYEREHNSLHAEYCLSENIWFLLTTNKDRDYQFSDDSRFVQGNKLMNEIGVENITMENMLQNILFKSPILVPLKDDVSNATFTSMVTQTIVNGDSKFLAVKWIRD